MDSEGSMPWCSAMLVRPNEYARTRILGVPIKIFILKFLMYINNNKLYLLISPQDRGIAENKIVCATYLAETTFRS